jgi:membrane protein implicated in regulation of membrane protease activity
MSIATISLWMACLGLTLFSLSLARAVTVTGAFWTYAAMSVLTVLFVWKFTSETKGKTLEEIERGWSRPSPKIAAPPLHTLAFSSGTASPSR